MSEVLSGSIGGLTYSDDNGDNGTDATDRRAVLAIAMETFSAKIEWKIIRGESKKFFQKKNIFFK